MVNTLTENVLVHYSVLAPNYVSTFSISATYLLP